MSLLFSFRHISCFVTHLFASKGSCVICALVTGTFPVARCELSTCTLFLFRYTPETNTIQLPVYAIRLGAGMKQRKLGLQKGNNQKKETPRTTHNSMGRRSELNSLTWNVP